MVESIRQVRQGALLGAGGPVGRGCLPAVSCPPVVLSRHFPRLQTHSAEARSLCPRSRQLCCQQPRLEAGVQLCPAAPLPRSSLRLGRPQGWDRRREVSCRLAVRSVPLTCTLSYCQHSLPSPSDSPAGRALVGTTRVTFMRARPCQSVARTTRVLIVPVTF